MFENFMIYNIMNFQTQGKKLWTHHIYPKLRINWTEQTV